MPEYLAPGVYVEEVSTGPKPIEGVSTSVVGFVGPTERGPETAELITSWLAFQRWYGGHLSHDVSYMTQAVQGYFDNGGKRCFVARVASKSAAVATLAAGVLQFVAAGRGAWGNRVFVLIKPATKAAPRRRAGQGLGARQPVVLHQGAGHGVRPDRQGQSDGEGLRPPRCVRGLRQPDARRGGRE